MATFSPHAFLTSQGWAGTGAGLRKDSIKKPVTVAHKTNLKGIGKERDTGYAWWDDVFSMVAGKKKGSETPEARKTSTGIHSPLPPGSLTAASSAPTSGSATPVASTSAAAGHFHSDIIGQAKLEAARREFYAKFLRGKPLVGTVDDSDEAEKEDSAAADTGDASEHGSKAVDRLARRAEKEERRRLRREKRDAKQKKKALAQDEQTASGPPTEVSEPTANGLDLSQVAPHEANAEDAKATEKAARKVERKRRKALADEIIAQVAAREQTGITDSESVAGKPKKKRKSRPDESHNVQDESANANEVLNETLEERQAQKAAKRARKAEKRRSKQGHAP